VTTETKVLALAELKERRQVLAFEVEQGRDGAVQELEVEQQVGALNQQQERQALAEKERHARAGADAQLAAQRRQQLGAAARAGLGRRPNSIWSTGGSRYRASRSASENGTAQTMANDPMKPLPIRRYEMTIDPRRTVRS
jgi:hypothetical protein